jgi:Domain of Unknown Function (DUF1080)
MNFHYITATSIAVMLLSVSASHATTIDYCDVEIPVTTPGTSTSTAMPTAPSDAIILFDGKDLSLWRAKSGGPATWIVHDGIVTVRKDGGDIETTRSFGDIQLHIEWRVPTDIAGTGQERGNSGLFLQDRYEIQILDSYNNRTFAVGQAGAIYGQVAPRVNAMRKPGEWNIYDVVYTAPRFNADGTVFTPARVTLFHNGVLAQNNVAISGNTEQLGAPIYERHGPAPIRLQAHGDISKPISFRNIWVRDLEAVLPPSIQHRGTRSAGGALSIDSPIGALLADRAAREVVTRCLPAVFENDAIVSMVTTQTLRQLQKSVSGLSDAKLKIIDAQLEDAQNTDARKVTR